MNRRQRKTLETIRQSPTPTDLRWDEVESLFKALGAVVKTGAGSRVRITLNGRHLGLHRPHPAPTLKRYVVRMIRDFLEGEEGLV